MINNGQTCISPKRILVHQDIFEEFLNSVIKIVKNMSNNKIVFGHEKVEKITKEQIIKALEEEGTKLIFGRLSDKDQVLEFVNSESKLKQQFNKEIMKERIMGGYLSSALVFDITDKNSILMREEIFGPVISLFKIASEREAIEICNDTRYGLAASVFTANKALQETLSKNIRCGMLFINKIPESMSKLPWGGIKNSGFGRDCSVFGLEQFTTPQTVVLD